MPNKKFKLVQQDAWLEPSEQDIIDRYNRYRSRLNEIETNFGSLTKFSDGYKYFGINYDSKQKGWTYREWAPEAYDLYLTGDFNNWEKYSHPLHKDEYGIWEIFLPEKENKSSFTSGGKVKVIVKSAMGELSHLRWLTA